MSEAKKEYWYRFEDLITSVADHNGDHAYTGYNVRQIVFEVDRYTSKGVWLKMGIGGVKWVSRTHRNAYARPTKVEALNDYVCRKRRQIQIYNARIEGANTMKAKALNQYNTLKGIKNEESFTSVLD